MPLKKIQSYKKAFLPLLLSLIFFFLFTTLSYATDYFVDDDCTGSGDGSSSDPFCQITEAISVSNSGDTVYVHDGTYAEAVLMKSGVNLQNVLTERPVVVTTSSRNIIEFNGVSNCSLVGFILDDSNRTTKGFAIVKVIGSPSVLAENITIKDCEIIGNQTAADATDRTGIRLQGKVSLEIIGNTIKNNMYAGISTKRTSPFTIYASTVTIQGNTIIQNGQTGMYLRGSGTGNRIIIGGPGAAGNIFANNSTFRGSGMWLRSLDEVSIENNEIANNGRAGILFEDVNTVAPHITGNSIHNNFATGINIGGSSNLIIGPNNDIFSNSIAGIAFFSEGNTNVNVPASSAPVSIIENNIYTNARAGIAVIDNVSGSLTITGNRIYQNERAGIAFLNNCSAVITENEIYDHTGGAGIFTGTWSGGGSPSSISPPATLTFNRSNGPVMLTIERNKIHNNLAGMRLDHASGTISNNLVYKNEKAGIRYSGNNITPYAPFNQSWGITDLTNNTSVDNGVIAGAGIVYDDINHILYDDSHNVVERDFFASPEYNADQAARNIINNITAYNKTAGIRDANCNAGRTYNLYYFNNGLETFIPRQTGGCVIRANPWTGNPGEIFSDPLFIDTVEYQLQANSPGKNSGSTGLDMGAYGGLNPITW